MTALFAIALLIGEIWLAVIIIKSIVMGELIVALIVVGCFLIYRKFINYWTKKVEAILEDIGE
jgi:uncharacterized membrane protein YcaP (DUF421 family)